MMLAIEERLFDEYKMVDKFCREIFSSQSGVTQYITEMERIASYGRSAVPSWNDDYYALKRVRWLRNKLAHESGATECNEKDAAWLENFHERLLAGQDPLALLRKARKRVNYPTRQESEPTIVFEQWVYPNADLRKKKASSNRTVVAAIVVVEVLVILAAVAVLIFFR